MGFKATAREDVDNGGVREEGVVAEGVAEGELVEG